MTNPAPAQSKKSLLWDCVFVVMLPIVCFALDPIFSESHEPSKFALYVLVVTLLALFWLSFVKHEAIRSLMNGSLLLGVVLAFLVGVFLLPMTVIGIFLIIGVLGLVPFATAFRYKKRFIDNGGSWPKSLSIAGAMSLGFILPVLPAAGTYAAIDRRLEPDIQAIEKGDMPTVKLAMENLGRNPFCHISCERRIVGIYFARPLDISEPEFRKLYLVSFGHEYDSGQISD